MAVQEEEEGLNFWLSNEELSKKSDNSTSLTELSLPLSLPFASVSNNSVEFFDHDYEEIKDAIDNDNDMEFTAFDGWIADSGVTSQQQQQQQRQHMQSKKQQTSINIENIYYFNNCNNGTNMNNIYNIYTNQATNQANGAMQIPMPFQMQPNQMFNNLNNLNNLNNWKAFEMVNQMISNNSSMNTSMRSMAPMTPISPISSLVPTPPIGMKWPTSNENSIKIVKIDIFEYLQSKPNLEKMYNDDRNGTILTQHGYELYKGLIQSLCETSEGSRHVQQTLTSMMDKFENDILKQKEILFEFYSKISLFAQLLCKELYGNYVINKFVQLCERGSFTEPYKKFINEIISVNLGDLANHQYSCRIVQNTLDSPMIEIKSHCFKVYISKLISNPGLLNALSKNQNGNHVIQTIIELSSEMKQESNILFIENYVLNNLKLLSMHDYACRVVQSIIKCKRLNATIIDQLFYHLQSLCNQECGNYAIQKCIEFGNKEQKCRYIEWVLFGQDCNVADYGIRGFFTFPFSFDPDASNTDEIKCNYDKLAFGKFSSNVCDTAFKHATMTQKSQLIEHITYVKCNSFNNECDSTMFLMVNHEYGNFVVKNIIHHLLEHIDQHVNDSDNYKVYNDMLSIVFDYLDLIYPILKNHQRRTNFTYAKNILTLLERHYNYHY